jgi:hypothetical protein
MDLLFNKIWMIYNHHKIHYKKITQWHIVFLKNNVVKIGAICVVHSKYSAMYIIWSRRFVDIYIL